MTKEEMKVMEDCVAAICLHDADGVAACFTKDCVYKDMALGETMRGREAVRTGYDELFAAIPDFKIETLTLFTAGKWMGSE
jgi:hypothetical protein